MFIAILSPEKACLFGLTKTLSSNWLEIPDELVDPLIESFLFLLDSDARCYFAPHVQIEVIYKTLLI